MVFLHRNADDVLPFADCEVLAKNGTFPDDILIPIGDNIGSLPRNCFGNSRNMSSVESCTSGLSVNALETCVLRDLAKSVTSFPRANRSEQRVL